MSEPQPSSTPGTKPSSPPTSFPPPTSLPLETSNQSNNNTTVNPPQTSSLSPNLMSQTRLAVKILDCEGLEGTEGSKGGGEMVCHCFVGGKSQCIHS